jgi:hypothetical protein
MSHFTVLVIGDNPEDQLAPYQENNMGTCPEEYLEFNDRTEEIKKEWEGADEETREKYKDFDSYATGYHGYEDNHGLYGYWHNPNTKWDWYQLGGRWTGFFKLKEGADGEAGTPGLSTDSAEPGYADVVMKKDIDFKSMMNEASKKAGETYDQIHEIIKGCDPIQSWEHIREVMFPGKIDEARAFYHAQPAVAKLNEWNQKNNHKLFGVSLENFQVSREDYCLDAARGSFVPFAVVKEGQWCERGEMGWWGMTSNETSKSKWTAQVAQLIDELPGETILSLYDCHI